MLQIITTDTIPLFTKKSSPGVTPCNITKKRTSKVLQLIGGQTQDNTPSTPSKLYFSNDSSHFHQDDHLKASKPSSNFIVHQGQLYSAGGHNTHQHSINTIECWQSKSSSWKTIGNLGKSRQDCGSLILGHFWYLIGGHCDGQAVTCVERIDLRDLTSSDVVGAETVAELAVGVKDAVVFGSHDVIYVVGGTSDDGIIGDIQAFDVNEGEVRVIRDVLPCGLAGAAVTQTEQRVFISGGFDGEKPRGEIYTFCHESQQVELVESMQIPRYGHSMAAFDDSLVILGGTSQDKIALKSVEYYEITTNLERPLELFYEDDDLLQGTTNGQLLLLPNFQFDLH